MEFLPDEQYHPGRRQAVVIGLAMIAGVFICAAIVEFLARTKAPFTGYAPLHWNTFSILRLALLGAALLHFALIPFLRRRILSASVRCGTASSNSGRLLSSCIISYALCDAIAVYGLVLFLINGAKAEFYVFSSLALLAFLINFPRMEKWEDWTEMTRRANGKGED